MKTPVVIKGARSGLTIVLDDKMEFDELKEYIAQKFSSSSEFLGNADVSIAFEGRNLIIEEIDSTRRNRDSNHYNSVQDAVKTSKVLINTNVYELWS